MLTSLGKIVVPQHHLLHTGGRFNISVYMQELGCYMGQLDVFDQASATLEKLTGVSLSDKQIERLCHYYGEEPPQSCAEASLVTDAQTYYAMADGSMLLTREKHEDGQCKWAEIKLGRIFSADSHLPGGPNQRVVTGSKQAAM